MAKEEAKTTDNSAGRTQPLAPTQCQSSLPAAILTPPASTSTPDRPR